MPDYIYLLESRLSADQQNALRHLRDAARGAEMILFLTGDAVRDLTSGHAVRELEVAVYGNAFKLKKPLEKLGAKVWGEDDASRTLYLSFPGTVRVDLVSTHSVEYKKPGQPTYHWAASIQEDLRRRDFTVNAMAISLNEGSYGLLMDPLNGVADIEIRSLRPVSNYGFLDEPVLLIRAIRYKARLGWEMDPRTQVRYENAKGEGVIESLSARQRSRELEQIGHEDDGLKVLSALEAEGWMKVLFPQWTHAKADVDKLHALHDLSVELLLQGIHADMSAAQMELLTAKMAPKDLSALKKLMLRPGFVEEWDSLDKLAAGFQKVLMAKDNQQPSAAYRLFTSYDPEAVLWLGFTSKDKAVKERYHEFLKVWPEMRQKVPYALMQEMRIRPELANYKEIVHQVFLQLIDGRLETPEEMKAFLEPYSPPAPPAPVTIKRTRGRKAEARVKETFEEDEAEESEEAGEGIEDLTEDEDELGLTVPKVDVESQEDEEEDEEEEDQTPKRGKAAARETAKKVPAKAAHPAKAAEPAHKPAAKTPAKPVHASTKATSAQAKPAKPVPAKHAPAKGKAAAPAKKAPAKHAAKPAVKKAALKPHSKPAHKAVTKATARPAAKAKPAAHAPKHAPKARPHAAHKPAPKKAGKKR